MKTFANWRAVGRAMLEARRRGGVVADAKATVGLAVVIENRWRFLDRAVITMVTATHAVGYDRTDVEISRRDVKMTFYAVSDAAELLRVLAALGLIPAHIAYAADERYRRCEICGRVAQWAPPAGPFAERWCHLDPKRPFHKPEVSG
jgi:hypothetical protein